jgi:hypothetical protein
MSEENVELARRFYPPGTFDLVPLLEDPALIDTFRPLVHPEFEMVGEAIAMEGPRDHSESDLVRRAVRGVDGFVQGWREFLAAWDSWVVTPTEFIDVDDERVLVMLDIRARSKTHQVEIPIDGANILTVQDGELLRLELYSMRPPALKAAGLSE